MELINALPLCLTKKQSVLDGLVLIEIIPVKRIKALLKSGYLLLSWGEDYNWDFHKKVIMEQYANESVQMYSYLHNYNKNLNGVFVKYIKPKHKWGRAFPHKNLGLSAFRRIVRNSLINGIYYDLDLKNAQPQIIRNLCESNNIPCSKIQEYCAERPRIRKMVADHYGVSEDAAKELFIRLCFFGSFNGWSIENKIQHKAPLQFITLFENELKNIAERVKKENPVLYETARKKKEDTGEVKDNKVLGSFFALYNQEYESRIVEAVMCYIINHTDLMKVQETQSSVGAYEYDGIKLLKENVDKFEGGIEGVVELLNEKTYELTGFHLEWTSKPFEDVYDLDEWIEAVEEDGKPNEELAADMFKISNAITNGDCGIIETLMEILPNHYIYSVDKADGSKGIWYGWNGNRWERSDAPLKKAIMYNVPEYWRSLMEKWDKLYEKKEFQEGEEPDCNYELWERTRKNMCERIYDLKKANGMLNCVSVAKTLMANYNLEFDTNKDLFGCENGVIDLEAEVFRPYQFDDFITFTCGYNFTPYLIDLKVVENRTIMVEDKKVEELVCRKVKESDLTGEFTASVKVIIDTYNQIFPDIDLRDYVFKILSTGLSGRAIEKFFVFNGAGRNGKGLTNEFMEVVLGNYFTYVSPIIYCENQKTKSSSGPNPEIAKLDKKRYIVSKEPQKDAPLHNSVIKDLTGGGKASGRMLYSSKTEVELCGTTIMECNEKPPFSEAPKDADAERINDCLFGSLFTDIVENVDNKNHIYLQDATLKHKFKTSIVYRNTMLNLLLHNLFMVKKESYNVDFFKPESVRQRSFAYLQNSYDIHTIFQNLFEIGCEENKDKYVNWKNEKWDCDWTLPKIAQVIRSSFEFKELSKSKQKEYTKEEVVKFFKTNRLYKKLVWENSHLKIECLKGYRLKPAEDIEEE